MLIVCIDAHCFYICRQWLLPYITKQVLRVVVVVVVVVVPYITKQVLAYTAQAHSAEEWSHLRSNPLELSSPLRSK
jgi:hypothetical protein